MIRRRVALVVAMAAALGGACTGSAEDASERGDRLQRALDDAREDSDAPRRPGRCGLFTVEADGSGLEPVAQTPGREYAAAWSTDGTLAFPSERWEESPSPVSEQ